MKNEKKFLQVKKYNKIDKPSKKNNINTTLILITIFLCRFYIIILFDIFSILAVSKSGNYLFSIF